jgi:ariadne-1
MRQRGGENDKTHGNRLAEELASLTRVRNRLAQSSDERLPKILPALLPKLLTLLEKYMTQSFDDPTYSISSSQAIDHVCGILAHAVERLKGSPHLPTKQILGSITPFVVSKSVVTSTWSITFLSIGMQRETPANSIPTGTMANLIKCVDGLHCEAIQNPPHIFPGRYFDASWMLLDCFMLMANFNPLLNWDMDYTPGNLHWENQKSDSWDALVENNAVSAASANGTGTFHLLLDLLLLSTSSAGQTQTCISEFGLLRISHRHRNPMLKVKEDWKRRSQTKWTENAQIYIRHLKLISLRGSIWPLDRGLFQGKNRPRALILSVVAASYKSMHGRLALDFLDKSPRHCSLAIMCSLLILIIGDEKALPILEAFQMKHPTRIWEPILGQIPEERFMQRPPLPLDLTEGVVAFLASQKFQKQELNVESRDIIKLLVDLCFVLTKRNDTGDARRSVDDQKRKKLWCVQIMKSLYIQLVSSSLIDEENPDEWAVYIFETCLDISVEVLSVVVEIGQSNVEKLRNHPDARPLGVPAPFGRRNDLNTLLNSHRESLKRRKLSTEYATDARQAAYGFISKLSPFSFNHGKQPFEIPILLLGCAVYEEEFLQHYVTTALDDLLRQYAATLDDGRWSEVYGQQYTSLQQLAIPLLPSLLDAICADSVHARKNSAKWINHILQKLDTQATSFLSSCMAKMGYANYSAETIYEFHEQNTLVYHTQIHFVDIDEPNGLECIMKELDSRVNELISEFDISPEVALCVLIDYDFSLVEAQADCRVNLTTTLCGLGLLVKSDNGMIDISEADISEARVYTTCGICYDTMTDSDAFAVHCGHAFCKECWQSFIGAASDQASLSFLKLKCPQQDCNGRIMPQHIQALDRDNYTQWNKALVNAFVEVDPSCRFCPGPDCNFVGMVSPLTNRNTPATMCDHCSTAFCFLCGELPHQPASCGHVSDWQRLVGNSSFWIKKNAKPCPGCNAPIEKDKGCNHMTCQHCRTGFCWLCLTKLRVHLETHSCNQYNGMIDGDDEIERRALFLANRYQAHEEAELFARDQHRSISESSSVWFLAEDDYGLLHEALGVVVEARKFLKNTYITSFGLRTSATVLSEYESHQGALELLTEKLSQLTEMNLQRIYTEKGEQCVINHFQRLMVYRVSVSNYMNRILNLNPRSSSLKEGD